MRQRTSRGLLLLLLLILPVGLFWQPLQGYFSQDDFYHLRTIMDKRVSDIPSFFVTRAEGQTFYRPLARETFNLLMFCSFGLNPLPFHIVNLVLIWVSAALILRLVREFTERREVGYLAAVIYSISAVHGVELYYLSSVETLFAGIFSLLGVLGYIFYVKRGGRGRYWLSLGFYVLGVLSHESVIILPGILFLVEVAVAKKRWWWRKMIWRLLPFAAVGGVRWVVLSWVLGLPNQSVYQPVFSLGRILNSLGWYIAWSFGLPEMLVDFVGPGLAVNPNLVKWYGGYLGIVLPVLGFLGLLLVSFLFWARKNLQRDKNLVLFLGAYILALAPFLFFPQHKFIYYLSFPTVWFAITLAWILSWAWKRKTVGRILVMVWALGFSFISYETTRLNEITYWAAKRVKAAEFLVNEMRRSFPSVEKGAVFYFKDDPEYPFISREWGGSSKQAFYVLSGADAIKLVYRDATIQAYFEDMGGLPEEVEKSRVIELEAKFPY